MQFTWSINANVSLEQNQPFIIFQCLQCYTYFFLKKNNRLRENSLMINCFSSIAIREKERKREKKIYYLIAVIAERH